MARNARDTTAILVSNHTGGAENAKRELTAVLGQAVDASVVVVRNQRVPARTMRRIYQSRRWGDYTWRFLSGGLMTTPSSSLAEVASALRPFLVDYQDPLTDRIGNGLYLLFGGPGTWRTPTVQEFGRTLVEGAAGLGVSRALRLFFGWIEGKPLRFRSCWLLNGVTVDGDLRLDEGVSITKLPMSSADLPASLPDFGVTAHDFMGGIVLAVDYELTPSLFRPEQDGADSPRLEGTEIGASGKIPNLGPDAFCESLALACEEWVGWSMVWRDPGELDAFYPAGFGWSGGPSSGGGRGTIMTQVELERARELHQIRHGSSSGSSSDLDQAIKRWMKSKRSFSDADSLIELRIALEALYGGGTRTEKAFRISTYGAWHLGSTASERRDIRRTLKQAYDDGSRAIHAGKLKHTRQDPELLARAQACCQQGILMRLEEPEPPAWDELMLG